MPSQPASPELERGRTRLARRIVCLVRGHDRTRDGFLTIEGQLVELFKCGRCLAPLT